jgi:CubicO group peptidase (beta-lactamase class C family)
MKIARNTLIILILLSLTIIPVSADNNFDVQDFRNFVNREMKNWNVPGLAVVIVKDGETILCEGFGHRDLANRKIVTPDTLFAIGSSTKAFTALGAGILVDEKKLDIDKPVQDYYPAFTMQNRCTAGRVTTRDLLAHRTGAPRYDAAWIFNPLCRDKAIESIRHFQTTADLRQTFIYNNYMYVLAGKVVETQSGTSWEDFTRTRILKPLGMNNSNFCVKEMQRSSNYSLGYILRKTGTDMTPQQALSTPPDLVNFISLAGMEPAGCINSSIKDMERWLRFQLGNGKWEGKTIVSEGYLAQMHSPQMVISWPPERARLNPEHLPPTYGLGWTIQPYRGKLVVQHGGNTAGFSAQVSFMPEKNSGIVILTNMNSTNLTYIIEHNFYDRLLGLDQIALSERIRESQIRRYEKNMEKRKETGQQEKKETTPSQQLENYVGIYDNCGFGSVEILLDDNRLNIKTSNMTYRLEHSNYDIFVMKLSDKSILPDIRVTFQMDKNGDISAISMPLEMGVDPIIYKKQKKN